MKIKKLGVLGLLLGLLFTAQANVFAKPAFSDVVVFGDSLSDPGNAFVLTGDLSHAPFSLIPDYAYARGGHHFSNGETWAEVLAKKLHVPSGPAFRNANSFSNYAVGGGRARSYPGVDLTTQVTAFLGNHHGVADPDALYLVFIGSNDVRDAIVEFGNDPTGSMSEAILQQALMSIGANLQALVGAGARHFLVANAPNLALVPAVSAQGPLAQYVAQLLSSNFNANLDLLLNDLALYPSVAIHRLDIFNLIQSVVSSPADFGITDVATPCITPDVKNGAFCNNPQDYLFWDGIHPTHAIHNVIATQAETVLQ